MNTARVGCSGWNYDDWRGTFYPSDAPRRRWLELYSRRFSTVEVNSTFYRLARSTAVENWVRDTPDGFMFAVKASRHLTHVKRLTDLDRGFKRLYEPLAPLIEAQRWGRCCGSYLLRFDATTTACKAGSMRFQPVCTRSSSATKAGSPNQCWRSCASAMSRSRSVIIQGVRFSFTRRLRPGGT
jgi:hypothetical protein